MSDDPWSGLGTAAGQQMGDMLASLGIDPNSVDASIDLTNQGPSVFGGVSNQLGRPAFDFTIEPGSLAPSEFIAGGGLGDRRALGNGRVTSVTVDANRILVGENGDIFIYTGDDFDALPEEGETLAAAVADNPRQFVKVGKFGDLEVSPLPGSATEEGQPGKAVIRSQLQPVDETIINEIAPRFNSPAEASAWVRRNIVVQDETELVDDLLTEMYTKSPQELADLQRRLFMAGFYPSSMDLNDIDFGVADEVTLSAWNTAVTRAANNYAAGNKVTVDEMLNETIQKRIELGRVNADGTEIAELPTIQLSDPAAIGLTADALGTQILGRKLKPEEQRLVVAAIHEAEKRTQTQASQAGPGDTITATSTQALLENKIRMLSPQEASTQSLATTIGNFRSMLGGF